ncbi:hypothetical protein [Polymorphospora sp. NPDC050346]|uniref:hypothetical protein n=1 Tax=Polymorphospora sp. NPDC050346 TaxID=3155780 RepID=UPI003402CB0A
MTQPSGDGEFAVLPPDEPEPRVVDDYVRELATELRLFNEGRLPDWQIRLRLAAHHGVAYSAANGYAGNAPVTVGRLIDSDPARRALAAAPEAPLAVILSRLVFDEIVAGGHTSLRPDDFQPVQVRVKEYADQAWVRVPGVDPARLPGAQPPDDSAYRHSAQRATVAGGGAVHQADRDIDASSEVRHGPTYVNRTRIDGSVHAQVFGFNFADLSGGGGTPDE